MATPGKDSKFGWLLKLLFWSGVALTVAYYALGTEFATLATTTAIKLAVLAGTLYLGYKVAVNSFFAIPPNQIAVMTRQWPGKEASRTGEVLSEMDALKSLEVCLKLPFVDKPVFYELKQQSYEFGATFIAMGAAADAIDGTTVAISGTLFGVPDFTILNKSGIPVYGTTTKEDIEKQLQVFASNKLASIGGSNTSDTLLREPATLNQILSGAFRLSGLAHRRHRKLGYPDCAVAGCSYPDGDDIKAEELMAFYKSHHAWVDKILASESKDPTDHSDAELAHGIDIVSVKVNPPCLSAKSQAAKDRINETKSKEKAAENELAYIRNVAEINPEEAVNYASEVFHGSSRVIYAGSLGILGGLVSRFAPAPASSPGDAGQPAPSSDGDGRKKKGGRK